MNRPLIIKDRFRKGIAALAEELEITHISVFFRNPEETNNPGSVEGYWSGDPTWLLGAIEMQKASILRTDAAEREVIELLGEDDDDDDDDPPPPTKAPL